MIEFDVIAEQSSRSECSVKQAGCRGAAMKACLYCGALLCDGEECSKKTSERGLSGFNYVVCPECAKQAKASTSA